MGTEKKDALCYLLAFLAQKMCPNKDINFDKKINPIVRKQRVVCK